MVDVVVVGGGPAGSATGALLAEQGLEVVIVDRARFPRDKPCGEYLTLGSARLLRSLGVWRALEAAGVRPLGRAVLFAPSGAAAVHRSADGEPAGWSLRRSALDAALLAHACSRGASVREGLAVRRILRRDGSTVVEAAVVGSSAPEEIRARLVIGADGTHSLVARGMGVVRQVPRLQRLAIVAHWRGIPGADAIEMRTRGRVVCGFAPLAGGEANVTLVVPRSEASRVAGRAIEYVEQTVGGLFPDLACTLAAGHAAGASTVGCFGHVCRRVSAAGTLLVGDAAAFVDPFTGEGVYHALRGAEIAADVAGRALRAGDVSAGRLQEYDRARGELKQRHALCALVQGVVRSRRLMERAVRRLAGDPSFREMILGVLGDVRPPSDALRATTAWRLLRAR